MMPILALCALAGCGSITVQDYADNTPTLVPEQFFNGQLTAHGLVKDRGGKVIRRFNADITAYWRDGVGTLEEDFVFDDGETDRRVWTLEPQRDGSYLGSAGDVVGKGRVTVAGNSMFLDYVLRIPYGNDTLDLHIDDRMYLVNPDTLINESRMLKFGFDVGAIVLVIQRQSGTAGQTRASARNR
jgi:hypothetical protein